MMKFWSDTLNFQHFLMPVMKNTTVTSMILTRKKRTFYRIQTHSFCVIRKSPRVWSQNTAPSHTQIFDKKGSWSLVIATRRSYSSLPRSRKLPLPNLWTIVVTAQVPLKSLLASQRLYCIAHLRVNQLTSAVAVLSVFKIHQWSQNLAVMFAPTTLTSVKKRVNNATNILENP